MAILYAILVCLMQLEVLVLLGLWCLREGKRGERSVRVEEPSAEETDPEKLWRETLGQLMAYSAETALSAARGGDEE